MIGGIREQGRRVATGGGLPEPTAAAAASAHSSGRLDAWIGAPRAAAAAVMGMLGFGVIVGSLVTGSVASTFTPVIYAIAPPSPHAAASPVGGAGLGAAGGGGSGGGGTVTITTTTPAPPTPAGAANAAASTAGSPAVGGGPATPTNVPPIKHVFMVVLSNQGYNQTFGHSANDPYLAKTLVKRGELLVNYYAVAGSPLANEIALVSGQGPDQATANDCPSYDPFIASGFGSDGQLLGSGCVFPVSAPSLADQLTQAKLTWKTYLETAGSQKQAQPEACHPRLGTSTGPYPTPTQPDAVWLNPFQFFSSLTKSRCPKSNLPLSRLARDLKKASTTPSFSYIVPDVCDDGSDTPCVPNAKAGIGAADNFLKKVIPMIQRSSAYRANGMIAITFDEAPQSGPYADSSSCCGSPSYPNMQGTSSTGSSGPTGSTGPTDSGAAGGAAAGTASTGSTGTTGTTGSTGAGGAGGGATNPTGGGGQVGLLLLSKYVKPDNPEVTGYYNHFSLLASIEQLFGFKRLGYAASNGVTPFGASVYTAYTGG